MSQEKLQQLIERLEMALAGNTFLAHVAITINRKTNQGEEWYRHTLPYNPNIEKAGDVFDRARADVTMAMARHAEQRVTPPKPSGDAPTPKQIELAQKLKIENPSAYTKQSLSTEIDRKLKK